MIQCSEKWIGLCNPTSPSVINLDCHNPRSRSIVLVIHALDYSPNSPNSPKSPKSPLGEMSKLLEVEEGKVLRKAREARKSMLT